MSHPLEAYTAGTITREARNRLVEEYLPLVQHVLGRLHLRLPQSLEREDIFEIGVLGLMSAAESYNPAKGAAFKTHAYVNIRGAILDEIRRHAVIPRSRRDRLRLIGDAELELETSLKRKPTPEELASATGLSEEQIDEAFATAHGVATLSLEDSGESGDEGPLRLIDSVRMPTSPNPSDEASKRELKAKLAKAIEELPERERRVVVLYYAEGLRLKEIGLVMNITESRVSQIHARAIYRLNTALTKSPKARQHHAAHAAEGH